LALHDWQLKNLELQIGNLPAESLGNSKVFMAKLFDINQKNLD
jgi:hypothetical protein